MHVQRDLPHLPTSSSRLELFWDHDSIPSVDSGSRHCHLYSHTHPAPSPHLRNVWLISIPTLISGPKSACPASVKWALDTRWLLELNNPCVHPDGFPAPLLGAPTQAPVPDGLLLGTCPHLSPHKVISYCKTQNFLVCPLPLLPSNKPLDSCF